MKMPVTPPSMMTMMKQLATKEGGELMRTVVTAGLDPTPDGKYRHWDTLRHLKPPSPNINHEEWWFAIKMARTTMYKRFPLKDANGNQFKFAMPDVAVEALHQIDCDASGRIALAEEVTNPATRDYYLVNSLMEEAITSSQLEGASTAHRVAKEMIRSGRQPRDVPEQMIFNNYRAMNHVRDIVKEGFSEKRILELHSMLTDKTLADPTAAGRYRRPDDPNDDIVVRDQTDNQTLHTPPPAEQLEARMKAMIDFANGKDKKTFIHPVVRSILLHFWLAYDHPFVDGNGRTARALFYWSMLKHGYWLSEYLSISRILKKGPSRYARAFLYTETDDNDATYFLLNQLAVIRQAIKELHTFLKHKMAEIRATESMIRNSVHFNHRQLALLSHALKRPNSEYTMEGHATSHKVSHETARADLYDLEKKGLLERRKQGRTYYFFAVNNVGARLKRL